MKAANAKGAKGAQAATSPRGRTGPFTFQARVVHRDLFFGVDLPAAVSKAIGKKGFVPVVGSVNGTPLRTSLSPSGGGRHHVLLNREVRIAANVAAGDRVTMVLRVDLDPPVHDIAEDLADALREEGVSGDFESLPRGRRNQYLRWLEEAAHEETRTKRIVRLVEIAQAQREKRVDRSG
jgi:hypothetical protein